jgi:signal transduction histidine kinase
LAVPCPPGADSPLRSEAEIQAHCAIEACGLTLLKTVTLIGVTLSAADGLHSIPPDVALCLYRVAQEALCNTAAHAGARQVHVTLSGTEDGLELVIADDGQGFNLAQAQRRGGLGLISLDERVRLVGGSLTINTQVTRGTELRVQVPLRGTR